MPVVPATLEAETGGLLNPGGRGCREPRLHHYTPAWATERHLKKKKKKQQQQKKKTVGNSPQKKAPATKKKMQCGI